MCPVNVVVGAFLRQFHTRTMTIFYLFTAPVINPENCEVIVDQWVNMDSNSFHKFVPWVNQTFGIDNIEVTIVVGDLQTVANVIGPDVDVDDIHRDFSMSFDNGRICWR